MKLMKKQKLLEEDTFLNLLRAHEKLSGRFYDLFKRYGLTSLAQYNILRILRGTGEQGLPCLTIANRLVNRVPDVTRLLDRMEAAGLILRERTERDRRVVIVTLTAKGRNLLTGLDEPVESLHRRQFSHLTAAELAELNRLLEKTYHHSIDQEAQAENETITKEDADDAD